MPDRFHIVGTGGISLVLDLVVGHIRSLEIQHNGHTLTPLYTAPWVDDPGIANDDAIPPNVRALSGDFFCAPFGNPDEPGVATHGWPANSRWEHTGTAAHPHGGAIARFALQKPVQGARLVKEITLRDGHPFVYQRHIFEGGEGRISVASHAMTRFVTRGSLSFSPKAYGETPLHPQESDPGRGRSALRYPARFDNLDAVPLRNGGITSFRRYPIAERHEDFAMLVEAPGSPLGWAAAVREDADDIVLSLKNPRDFPVTMLWFSNGGRDFRPWNGRNVGVLGMEEGRTWSANGYRASIAPNPLSDSGVPTALDLEPDGSAEVRHVIGGVPAPEGWQEIRKIEAAGGGLHLTNGRGDSLALSYDPAFLARGP